MRLCDQHEAMAGITSSSDMYLLLIMICNRQQCASLYSTVEGLTTSLTSLGSDSAMWSWTTSTGYHVRSPRDYRYAYPGIVPQKSSVLQIRVTYPTDSYEQTVGSPEAQDNLSTLLLLVLLVLVVIENFPARTSTRVSR